MLLCPNIAGSLFKGKKPKNRDDRFLAMRSLSSRFKNPRGLALRVAARTAKERIDQGIIEAPLPSLMKLSPVSSLHRIPMKLNDCSVSCRLAIGV